jgi:hypothetical protein
LLPWYFSSSSYLLRWSTEVLLCIKNIWSLSYLLYTNNYWMPNSPYLKLKQQSSIIRVTTIYRKKRYTGKWILHRSSECT